jgi:ankyrin repeat protein
MEGDNDEIVLYEEENKNNEERIENSTSDIETISDEEYLLECARYGDTGDLIALLKEVNIDINYKDFRGNTALRKEILNILDLAAANGHLEIIKVLIANKIDINFKNSNNNTALRKGLLTL